MVQDDSNEETRVEDQEADEHDDDMINEEAWQDVGSRGKNVPRGSGSKKKPAKKNTDGGQRNLRSLGRRGPGPHG